MWLQVRHWFRYSWSNLVTRLGTTTLSVSVFSFLVPLLIFVALTAVHWREERRKGVSVRKIVTGALLSWATIIPSVIYIVTWSALLASSLGKTASTDHNNLLARIRQLNREKKEVAAEAKIQIDDLNSKLKAKPKEIIRTQITRVPTLVTTTPEPRNREKITPAELSDVEATVIRDDLKRFAGNSVRIVCVGQPGTDCDVLGRLFLDAKWNVRSVLVGTVVASGLNFPPYTYITGPNIGDPLLAEVFSIFQKRRIDVPLTPNAYMGPLNLGQSPAVVIVIR